MGIRVEVSKRVGGVRLLLRKPFLEPMNEGNMRGLAEEAKRRERKPRKMRSLLMLPAGRLPVYRARYMEEWKVGIGSGKGHHTK